MTHDEFNKKFIQSLNEQQQAAVLSIKGAVLLLAVPGSGKTTVLVARLGYMVCCENISPDNILTMTYTVAGMIGVMTYHILKDELINDIEVIETMRKLTTTLGVLPK